MLQHLLFTICVNVFHRVYFVNVSFIYLYYIFKHIHFCKYNKRHGNSNPPSTTFLFMKINVHLHHVLDKVIVAARTRQDYAYQKASRVCLWNRKYCHLDLILLPIGRK